MSAPKSLFIGIIGVFLLGCAADSHRDSGPGGPNDNGSAGSGNNGSGGTGNFGNSNGQGGSGSGLQGQGGAGGASGGNGSSRDPVNLDECGATNPAGLSPADTAKLTAGSGGPGALRMVYPYDGTVFPRGLLAPTLMWDGVMGDVVYVHIKSMLFEYKGCLKPTAAGQLQLAQDVWDKAGQQTTGKNDPYTVELTVMQGGTVTGPFTQTIKIAQATIKGSIYYNSYSSKLSAGGLSGIVLRIPPHAMVEAFVSNECTGCHSVSADGSRLISQTLGAGGRSYALAAMGMPNPTAVSGGPRAAFGALYPDGSKFLQTSTAMEVARAALTSNGSVPDSQLYDSATGNVVMGTGIPKQALMPVFSPSGKKLAFNDYAQNTGHVIAMMDYDTAADTASNPQTLYTESSANIRPAWPFFLPDDNGIVFLRTDAGDFSGGAAGIGGAAVGSIFTMVGAVGTPFGELNVIDVKSKSAIVLAQAMGYANAADAASGKTYLPFGMEDLHHNYYPTVSPVAAGGYFWVFFDSYRHYGVLGMQRQLWAAAVDISPTGDYTVDPSHPAFYLPGQELGTGNHRAFAALDPCKMDGDSCTSGIDCCGGFCSIPMDEDPNTEFGVEPVGTCTAKPPRCSERDERCTTNADCCPAKPGEPQNTCIGGFCAFVEIPQ
jgi:hypothetical protein